MEKGKVEGRGVEVGLLLFYKNFYFFLYQRDSAVQAGEIHLLNWNSIGQWFGLMRLLHCCRASSLVFTRPAQHYPFDTSPGISKSFSLRCASYFTPCWEKENGNRCSMNSGVIMNFSGIMDSMLPYIFTAY